MIDELIFFIKLVYKKGSNFVQSRSYFAQIIDIDKYKNIIIIIDNSLTKSEKID